MKTPFEEIKEKISNFIPENLVDLLPKKWEKIGDVLVLKLKKELDPFAETIAKTYAEVLNCKSVLQEIGGIKGIYREPQVRLIYGSKNTETLHVENGIKYSLDPSKLMFSSGNMSERIRMSKLNCRDEVVVDMFAGIGYFSLPIAVYCNPRMVYAIEKNPLAFRYLCKNITLNRVNDRVEPILGDNRCVTPKGVANRVIMGYLNKTHEFLPIALESLKSKGIIHFHCLCPRDKFPDYVMDKIRGYLSEKEFEVVYKKVVKSYAPGIDHVVLDIKVE
ncbi:MAG: class I SAM-dependent methyltransferase family protein [Thermoplasmata archaeon]|nr:MAG: class I SAM-dependent methyltransferase family protein [Thermoplasmata archaeon]